MGGNQAVTSPAEIIEAVHQATGCPPAMLISRTRVTSILFPRWIALLLLRDAQPFHSADQLGIPLGMIKSGTARHALRKARQMLDQDADFKQVYNDARTILNETKPTP
jgi:chromosomal replication initiation ATPase DnaA